MFTRISVAGLIVLSALCIFAEEVKWPKPPNGYASASPDIPKGTLTGVINYPTRNYQNRPCRIYTPPGFSKTRTEKYPVLYLHHGIGGNENAWTSNAGHAEGYADKVMDYLYAQDDLDVTPMIVVMPMGNMTGTSGDTWQNFEDVLINDLAPYIEKNYNGSSNPDMRAIAGLSMGGGQTLNFGYGNPEVFTWIGAFSPAPNTIAAGTNIKDIDAVITNVHLNFMAAGTASGDAQCLNTARTYHDYLDNKGVSNLYLQVEQGLGHERENWNRQLHNFAKRIFKGITGTGRSQPTRLVTAATGNRTTIQVYNGLSGLMPSTGKSVHTETGSAVPHIFTLDGRCITPLRTGKAVLHTIGRIR
jgi:enterochelin esterase-like enzyme